jgi:4-amino-4-deoxy-L-arabinose transferase-like glycosyltransferase
MLPLATSDKPTAQFLADNVYDITDHLALTGLTVLGIGLAIAALFLFKNRPLQLKVGYLVISLAILLPLAAFLLFTNQEDQAGVFLPAGAILFTALANYFVRKDDKLVKSMDRLR